MPAFRLLDDVRNTAVPPPEMPTTGLLRERLGGDVSMRAVAMSLFALAFLDCKRHGIGLQEMAQRLGTLDWHMLDCERSELANDGLPFAEAVKAHMRPEWSSLLVLGPDRRPRARPAPSWCPPRGPAASQVAAARPPAPPPAAA